MIVSCPEYDIIFGTKGDDNMLSYIEQIENEISKLDPGKVFIANDFLEIASYETVRKSLNRLVDDDKIKRVINGFYHNPEYSELIQEYAAPSMHELAIAIARKYNWNIAPYGSTALNILGLSTQVPSTWTYISSGRNKTYHVSKRTIVFKKVKLGEIANMSLKTATIIQAIKALGRDRIRKKDIQTMRSRLSQKEKTELMNEATAVSAWIYEIIRELCEGENE
ncbi:MAG: hypothetical protein BWY50_00801 [Spirochaetes bacterium ADurb.Bin315]|jgi:hypothetical protein|nr:MAG: hypothetical protein BWY50_00801 [Spirochaetes bacterium ADurb.Bin315]